MFPPKLTGYDASYKVPCGRPTWYRGFPCHDVMLCPTCKKVQADRRLMTAVASYEKKESMHYTLEQAARKSAGSFYSPEFDNHTPCAPDADFVTEHGIGFWYPTSMFAYGSAIYRCMVDLMIKRIEAAGAEPQLRYLPSMPALPPADCVHRGNSAYRTAGVEAFGKAVIEVLDKYVKDRIASVTVEEKQKFCQTGQVYVKELSFFTPQAPVRDYVSEDSKPYWGWTSMGNFIRAVGQAMWKELNSHADKAGGVSLGAFPDYPPYPVAALKIGDNCYFSEQQLLDVANEIIENALHRALPIIIKAKEKM